LILAEATEEGLTQRECVISMGLREANTDVEEGRNRVIQSHAEARRVDELAEGVVLPIPRLRRAKRLNPSVTGTKEAMGSLRE